MKFYTIKKGEHSTGNRIPVLTFSNTLSYKVRFNGTARYRTEKTTNMLDVNKLFGLSDKWTYHKTNSARFGWRYSPFTDKIQILAYVYSNGSRIIEHITNIDIDRTYEMRLTICDSSYNFLVKDNEHALYGTNLGRRESGVYSLKYRLFPYFGGDETAPHTITIEMEKL